MFLNCFMELIWILSRKFIHFTMSISNNKIFSIHSQLLPVFISRKGELEQAELLILYMIMRNRGQNLGRAASQPFYIMGIIGNIYFKK